LQQVELSFDQADDPIQVSLADGEEPALRRTLIGRMSGEEAFEGELHGGQRRPQLVRESGEKAQTQAVQARSAIVAIVFRDCPDDRGRESHGIPDGFLEYVPDAEVVRAARDFRGDRAGDEHDGDEDTAIPYALREFDPRHSGHLHVRNDGVGITRVDEGKGELRRLERSNAKTALFEDAREKLAHQAVVVYDEDSSHSPSTPASGKAPRMPAVNSLLLLRARGRY
jgi:hypothetical protein